MSDHELMWMSARQLAGRIAAGDVSAREALQAHWDRIDEVNPLVNTVVYENRERAWEHASAADARQARGEALGPLHGIPMTNKDSNDTAGMPTTSGSPLLQENVPSTDSLIVGRMRAAGAIMTGKNNVPEFAAGAHTFNEVFGTTRNPYDLGVSAGGSSGGVAAAVAAGIQTLGDGSDMGGSLRVPASFCNVVGLRPSRGRVPEVGRDSWAWLGRKGPIARYVDDVALAMSVIAGPNPRSPLSIDEDPAIFTGALERDLTGLRVGFSLDLGLGLPVEPAVRAVVERALAVFTDLGAVVEEAAPDLREADLVFAGTRANDFEMRLGDLVRGTPELVKPEVLENVELGHRQTAADLRELAFARTRLEGRVRDYFERYDLLLTITAQTPPFPAEWRYPTEIDGSPMHDYLEWMRSVCVVSAMDVPAISVPGGFTENGLPVGIQLVAAHGGDRLLLEAASAYEQATRWSTHRPESLTDEITHRQGH